MSLKKDYSIFCHIFAVAFIIVMGLLFLNHYNMIVVLNDEFGYWSNAELLVRGNWYDLAKETPYYAIGYSLILAPIVAISDSAETAYHMAIILNVFFLLIDYCCAVYIIKSLRNKETFKFADTMKALVAVLPSFALFYVHIGWCETFLTMLFWLVCVCFVSIEKKYSIYKCLILLCLLGYIYITHQRTIGILLCVGLVLEFYLLKNKKYAASVIVLAGIAGIVMGQGVIKDFQNRMINYERVSALNEYTINGSLVSDKLGKLFSNTVQVIVSACGKYYAAFLISSGMIGFGVISSLKDMKSYFKEKRYTSLFFSRLFIVLCALAMIALSTLQALPGGRKDNVVYSRYMEFSFGPAILVALDYFFINIKKCAKQFYTFCIALFPITLVVLWSYTTSPEMFNIPCSILIGSIIANQNTSLLTTCLFFLIVFMILAFIISYASKMKDNYAVIIICGLFIALNLFSAYSANIWLRNIQDDFYYNVSSVEEELENNEDWPVYFLKNDETNFYSINPKYLQFRMWDRPIIVVKSLDDIKTDESYYLLTNPDETDIEDDYYEVERTVFLTLYQRNS